MGRKSRKKQIRNADTYKREMTSLTSHLHDKASGPVLSGARQWQEFMDIHKLVEAIREKQADLRKEEPPRADALDDFMSWLNAHEIKTDHVEIEDYPDKGYGLKALQDIKVNKDLLTIPRKVMLTTETAKTSCLGNLVAKDRVLQAMPNILLSVHVLCEKYLPDSFWQPYIKTLPRTYTTPLYFTMEELQMLKESPALEDALKQYKNIARQYAYFYRLFQNLPDSTQIPLKDNFIFDDYRWAVSTVMTRQNQIPAKDAVQLTTALVPLWDMCNHANGSITTGFDIKADSLHCIAMRDFKAGDQLLIFYGARTNAEMLIHDGFVYPENQKDKTTLKLGVSKNDSLFAMKAELLARMRLAVSGTFFLSNTDKPVTQDLLAFLRIFSMNEDELKTRLVSPNVSKLRSLYNADSIVSIENETKVWTFLDARLNLLLKMYKSTIQEDEAILEKGDLTDHARLIIQLKLTEKKILQKAKDYGNLRKEAATQNKLEIIQEEEEEEEDSGVAKQQVNGVVEVAGADEGAVRDGVEETAKSDDKSTEVRSLQTNHDGALAEDTKEEPNAGNDRPARGVQSTESSNGDAVKIDFTDIDYNCQEPLETQLNEAADDVQDGTQELGTKQQKSAQGTGNSDAEIPQVMNGTTDSSTGITKCGEETPPLDMDNNSNVSSVEVTKYSLEVTQQDNNGN
ncbi:actin-histidine N-methyltransferase-like [Ptychodera flava]|uniref:actin-histidine N-methyltransferase-like n=1 Tax=Ptychodera flava TaxID=63121 RepID=UPI00396A6D01